MATTFAERSLPPGDRADAPEPMVPEATRQAMAQAECLPPPVVADALPAGAALLADELQRAGDIIGQATADFMRARNIGDRALMLAALQRIVEATDVKALARSVRNHLRQQRE